MRIASGLVAQIEAAAAVGAHLGAAGAPVAPGVDVAVNRVVGALGSTAFDDLTPAEAAMVRGFLRSFLRQAGELLENPGRPAGWSFEDPVILETIGQTSRTLVRGFARLAEAEPDLAGRLTRPARFLDAGTGVGWIAIDAARHWPSLSVTGIDIFQPALDRAAANVAAAGMAGRVTLRHQDVTRLDEPGAYAMAFLAAPFLPEAILPAALASIRAAMEPGGWLGFGLFEAPPDPLSQALLGLRVTRFGGRVWTVEDAAAALAAAGFTPRAESILVAPGRLVFGRNG